MLEKANRTGPAAAADEDGHWPAGAAVMAAHDEIDNELQAAIEYKIALAGVGGAEKVIDLLNAALRRQLR